MRNRETSCLFFLRTPAKKGLHIFDICQLLRVLRSLPPCGFLSFIFRFLYLQISVFILLHIAPHPNQVADTLAPTGYFPLTSLFLIFPVPSNRTGLAVTPWTPFSTLNREPCNTQLGSRPATGLTACADSEGTSVRWVPGVLGERGGKAELAAQTFFPAVPNTPSRPAAPAVPAPSPSPGPARPGTSFCTPLTSHAAAAPRGAEAGPGGGSRRDGLGGEPRGGVGVSPGRGWVPQAPLSVVPLFEIGAGGALRSRDGASPIGTGLSPGSGPERSASGGAAAAAGRAGKAGPRRSWGGGRDAGTRGRAAAASERSAPPRPSQPRWATSFRSGARHSPG